MREIPPSAWAVAGFTLAHATSIVSQLPDDDLLVPFLVVERSSDKQIILIGAATQAKAVAEGKKAMASLSATTDAWAFGREASYRPNVASVSAGPDPVDAFVIDFWATGMQDHVTLIQRFQRSTKLGAFRLLDDPIMALGRDILPLEATPVQASLGPGIRQYGPVPALADRW